VETSPSFLQVAHPLLREALTEVFQAGFVLFCQTTHYRRQRPIVRQADAALELLEGILTLDPQQVYYPIGVWLGVGDDQTVCGAIRRAIASPMDDEVYKQALVAGAIWFSVDERGTDVICGPSKGEWIVGVFRGAAEGFSAGIEWKLWEDEPVES
jgi:hypothetical protein